jgi:predicted RNase H-like HicB family nuclease
MLYPVAIELGDAKHAYGVAIPDLKGAYSAGDTLDEAMANAEDAILLALEDYLDEGKPFPTPTDLETLQASKEWNGWTWGVVNVDLTKLDKRVERINVTISGRVLDTIDKFAKSHGENRSAFLARAALETMAREVA